MAATTRNNLVAFHSSALCLPSQLRRPSFVRSFPSPATISRSLKTSDEGHVRSPTLQSPGASCSSSAHIGMPSRAPLPASRLRHQGVSLVSQSRVWGLGLTPGSKASLTHLQGRVRGLAPLRATPEDSKNEEKSGEAGPRPGAGTTTVVTEEKGRDSPEESAATASSSHSTGASSSETGAEGGSKMVPKDQQSPSSSSAGSSKGVQLDQFSMRELLGPEKVDSEDVKLIRDKVFGYGTFWVTGQEPFGDSGEGVLLRGNLRGNRESVFAKLQDGMRAVVGEKYDLFMVEEPNSEDPDPRGGPRVSFILFRREVSQGQPTTVWQYIIALLLAAITAGACLELGLACQELPPDVIAYFQDPQPENVEPPDVEALVPYVQNALPLAYGVFGVQIFHDVGHRVLAAQRRVEMGIPYLIPNISVGSFGAITQFKSVLPDRTTKFDISIAGPLAGGALSLAMFASGLSLSIDPEGQDALVKVPALLLQGSLLFGGACRAVLGYDAVHAATVGIHPLVIAGWCGLTTTAFNLLPVGCLDGGRAMQAAYGKVALTVSSITTYLLLGLGVLGGPLSLPWGLYILIVQRNVEKPALNDVQEVGRWRQGVFAAVLALVLLSLVPMWPELADELGIGLGSVVL